MAVVYIAGMGVSLFFLLKKKIGKKSAIIIMAGSVIALFLYITGALGQQKETLEEIERSEKAGKEKTVSLEAEVGEEKKTIQIQILPQEYTDQELLALSEQLWKEVEEKIPGKNKSLDKVTESLYFPEEVDGYPFLLRWHTDAPSLLSAEGQIGEDIPREGSIVEIRLQIVKTGSDFKAERTFFANLYPSEREDAFWKRLEKSLIGLEKNSRMSQRYILPDHFEGHTIIFRNKKEEKSYLIFLLAVGASIAVRAGEKREEENGKKRRLQEMELEYADMIARMAMLIGAGMTISGAFKKIAGDYGKRRQERKKPLYEELLITSREMDSGISEGKAYQNLGNRCHLSCLMRFTALLAQYHKSGSFGLKNALKEETYQALQERKERAKRLGEEAGTKLLLPMTLMLVLVMIIIMIPAFTSFGI
ncbi:MAG: hypothetical protein HFI94_06345 [Lachnospiraceae bacterium]|jgi:hypothetical protein|nr:hypothetical protein [Lachnospiraceae bacterium]